MDDYHVRLFTISIILDDVFIDEDEEMYEEINYDNIHKTSKSKRELPIPNSTSSSDVVCSNNCSHKCKFFYINLV